MINQEKTLELVDRSQRKDTAAFAQLVTEFQPMVFRLAFRLLCDENEARDITQETFVKVWLSLKRYNRKNRFSTWLYKITCNACYDRLRSLRHSSLNNEFAFSDSINLASDDNIEISLSNRQLKELIKSIDTQGWQRDIDSIAMKFFDQEVYQFLQLRIITGA